LSDYGWRAAQAVGRPNQELEAPKVFLLESESFADTSLDAVTLDGSGGVPAGDQDPDARLTFGAAPNIKKVAAQAVPLAFTQQLLELRLAAQPAACIEPESLGRRRYNRYSPTRRRPRARRLRNTARPPRVRLRTRKPWRRARRVLDGWYVRFMDCPDAKKGGIRACCRMRCQIEKTCAARCG